MGSSSASGGTGAGCNTGPSCEGGQGSPAACSVCTSQTRAVGLTVCPTRERLDAFRDQSRGQASSVIVTLFGDAVLPRGGRIWLGSLITLLEPLGLNERLVRTSVFRLAQDDWLETEVHGRRSNYMLTPTGRRRFEEAARQIYAAAAAPWDHRWRLIMLVGSLPAAQREQLKRALFWHGFGELGTHSFVHPGADLGAVFEALEAEGMGELLPQLLPLMAANPKLLMSGTDADMVERRLEPGAPGGRLCRVCADLCPHTDPVARPQRRAVVHGRRLRLLAAHPAHSRLPPPAAARPTVARRAAAHGVGRATRHVRCASGCTSNCWHRQSVTWTATFNWPQAWCPPHRPCWASGLG
jgi:hypothetical protein